MSLYDNLAFNPLHIHVTVCKYAGNHINVHKKISKYRLRNVYIIKIDI
jgi:hypothetical protein